ncbi:MAG: phosphate ABC transporter permease [Synechococcales bacterium]|nr:phosphate ABC transporter permease [Synechococcales bacterium]
MLIPLNRKTLEDLIPLVATGPQYRYYWGTPSDVLRRVLISIAIVVGIVVIELIIGEAFDPIAFIAGSIGLCYWLWSPIYFAGKRNREYRRFEFGGFWRGEVVDKFITEELIGTEETVNKYGDLVIIENRERRLNLTVGDDTGFTATIQVPLKREHRPIRQGDWAEMLVVSNRADLSRITKVTDIYLPDYGFWVSDYPAVQRNVFKDVSRRLQQEWRPLDEPPRPPLDLGERGDRPPRHQPRDQFADDRS